jgi:hypothetical protein
MPERITRLASAWPAPPVPAEVEVWPGNPAVVNDPAIAETPAGPRSRWWAKRP